MSRIRWTAGWALAAMMTLAAALHLYWGVGGRWLLSESLGVPLERVEPGTLSRLMMLVWPFAAAMLVAAWLALGRIGVLAFRLPRWCFAVGLWGFAAVMALGAWGNLGRQAVHGRFVFGGIFLLLTVLALLLAWPQRRAPQAAAAR